MSILNKPPSTASKLVLLQSALTSLSGCTGGMGHLLTCFGQGRIGGHPFVNNYPCKTAELVIESERPKNVQLTEHPNLQG